MNGTRARARARAPKCVWGALAPLGSAHRGLVGTAGDCLSPPVADGASALQVERNKEKKEEEAEAQRREAEEAERAARAAEEEAREAERAAEREAKRQAEIERKAAEKSEFEARVKAKREGKSVEPRGGSLDAERVSTAGSSFPPSSPLYVKPDPRTSFVTTNDARFPLNTGLEGVPVEKERAEVEKEWEWAQVVTAGPLVLRAEADIESPMVGELPPGSLVEIKETAVLNDGTHRVRTDKGWCTDISKAGKVGGWRVGGGWVASGGSEGLDDAPRLPNRSLRPAPRPQVMLRRSSKTLFLRGYWGSWKKPATEKRDKTHSDRLSGVHSWNDPALAVDLGPAEETPITPARVPSSRRSAASSKGVKSNRGPSPGRGSSPSPSNRSRSSSPGRYNAPGGAKGLATLPGDRYGKRTAPKKAIVRPASAEAIE